MIKVVVITRYSQFEQTVNNKAEAIQFKNQIEEGRVVLSYSISEVTPEKVITLPEGYQ